VDEQDLKKYLIGEPHMLANLKHRDLTQVVIGTFFEVYNELGHGFLESVYQKSLRIALEAKGLDVCCKIEIPVWFRGNDVGRFEADLLVEKCLLLELKAVRQLDTAHQAQLLNYLRATDIEVGLLLNFGLKPDFKRMAFDNVRKTSSRKGTLFDALRLKPEDN
jgi:GxxExxY protein